MTAFFVGGSDMLVVDDEDAYTELREISEALTNCPPRLRRIHKLRCRLDGRDQEIEVGQAAPRGEGVVAAILDHGRNEAFVVHTTAGGGGVALPLRIPNPVYGVTEFSAA